MLEADKLSLAPSQLAVIDQIIKAGWHLSKLIDENLNPAVIEPDELSMAQESLSLSEVLRECRAMMKPQAQMKGILLSKIDR